MNAYNALVLPIHPEYYDLMNLGVKKYEIRSYDFKKLKLPAKIFLHVTKKKKHPYSGYIAAVFTMTHDPQIVKKEAINQRVVSKTLLQLVEESAISIKVLRDVSHNKDARFIRVNDFRCLKNPVKLSDIGLKVPQSFMYLFDDQVKRIEELEGVPF